MAFSREHDVVLSAHENTGREKATMALALLLEGGGGSLHYWFGIRAMSLPVVSPSVLAGFALCVSGPADVSRRYIQLQVGFVHEG